MQWANAHHIMDYGGIQICDYILSTDYIGQVPIVPLKAAGLR